MLANIAKQSSHPQDKSLACSTRWALWTNWERTRSWSEIHTGCYKSARKNTNYGLGISDSVCGCTSSPCVCNVLRRWELHFMLGTCDAEWREAGHIKMSLVPTLTFSHLWVCVQLWLERQLHMYLNVHFTDTSPYIWVLCIHFHSHGPLIMCMRAWQREVNYIVYK